MEGVGCTDSDRLPYLPASDSFESKRMRIQLCTQIYAHADEIREFRMNLWHMLLGANVNVNVIYLAYVRTSEQAAPPSVSHPTN